jgi:hypothetical protein
VTECQRCKQLESQIEALSYALTQLRAEASRIRLHVEVYVVDYLRKLAGEKSR